jgi:hypothetical protein
MPRRAIVTGRQGALSMHPQVESREYQLRAAEAERRAARSVDPDMKTSYLKIALQYQRLAQEAAER